MVTVSAARSIIGAAPSPHPSPSLLLLEKINQLNTIIYLPVSRTDQAHCDWIMQMSTSIISNGLWIDLCLRGGERGEFSFWPILFDARQSTEATGMIQADGN